MDLMNAISALFPATMAVMRIYYDGMSAVQPLGRPAGGGATDSGPINLPGAHEGHWKGAVEKNELDHQLGSETRLL